MEVSSHAGKDVSENVQGTNGQVGRPWGWDDEGVVMDINILLSEFGAFSDFFQEEELDFGEVGILYSSCSMFDSTQRFRCPIHFNSGKYVINRNLLTAINCIGSCICILCCRAGALIL